MVDHFATLAQPRRPWLDEAALKEAFHRASAKCHPDVPESGDAERFAAVNVAYQTLSEPATRLRHLLEFAAPGQLAPDAAIPPDFADHFMRVAATVSALDTFQRKQSAAVGPLAHALLFEEKLALTRRAETTRADLEAAHTAALADLRALDSAWPSTAFDALAAVFRRLTFLAKWRAQLDEALFKLAS